MKAVVIKINKSKAVVLMSDGTFHNVLNKDYVIGQEIYIAQVNKTVKFSRLAKYAAAAAAALIVLIGAVSYAYTIPQSYISMDVNPSIEFEVNIYNRVINPQGANQDGKELLNKVSIENKKIEDAIHAVISQLKADGYIVPGGKSVVLGVQSDNQKRQEKMMENARMQVEKSLESLHLSAQVSVSPVTEQTIENAHDAGTTGGKLELIEEYLEEYPNGLTFNELMAMSVSDILHELNNEHQENDNYENDDDDYDDYDDNDHYDDKNNENADIEDDEHSEDEIDYEYPETSDDESDYDQHQESDVESDDESNDEESDDEESDDEESDDEETDEYEEHYETSDYEEEEYS